MTEKKTTFCLNCGNTIDGRAPVCGRCGSKRMKSYLSAADWQLVSHLRRVNGLDPSTGEDASEQTEATAESADSK